MFLLTLAWWQCSVKLNLDRGMYGKVDLLQCYKFLKENADSDNYCLPSGDMVCVRLTLMSLTGRIDKHQFLRHGPSLWFCSKGGPGPRSVGTPSRSLLAVRGFPDPHPRLTVWWSTFGLELQHWHIHLGLRSTDLGHKCSFEVAERITGVWNVMKAKKAGGTGNPKWLGVGVLTASWGVRLFTVLVDICAIQSLRFF